MTRPPLSDEERAVLTGRMAPPRVPFTVRDRAVARETWAEVVLADVDFEDVDFEELVWSGPKLSRCAFRRVSFLRSSLLTAELADTTFEACRFEESEWVSCEFARCRIDGAELEECRALRCHFRASELAGLGARGWELFETSLSGCRLADCRLFAARFERGALRDVRFSGGTLEGLKSSYTDFEDVTFENVRVDGVELVGGVVVRLALRAVAGRNVLVSQVDLDGLRLEGCNGLAFVRVADAEVTDITVTECAPLKGFSIHASNLRSLALCASTLTRFGLSEVDAGGPSSIAGSLVGEWTFRGGSWRDLTIADTALADLVEVKDTAFERLRFERVSPGAALVVRSENVAYVDCAATWEEVARGG